MLKNAFAFAPMLVGAVSSQDCCSVEQTISCDSDDTEDTEEKEGCCTDDCHCVCCHAFYTLSDLEKFYKPNAEISNSEYNYYNSYTHRFTHGVWQPPRLV